MAKQEEAWEIAYQLTNAGDGMTVARGKIKDYPSAEEALERLGERVATAVAGELLPLADPAPWKLVLTFEVSKRADPLTAAAAAAQLAALGPARPAPVMNPEDFFRDDSGIDLAACLDDDNGE